MTRGLMRRDPGELPAEVTGFVGRQRELPLDADATQDRHIAYFRAMAGEFSRHAKDDDQLPRYRRLRAEHPDLRAALGYALDRPGPVGEAARLAADLRAYWEISGLLREGKYWLTRILLRFPGPSAERAWLLLTRGVLGTLAGRARRGRRRPGAEHPDGGAAR